MEAIEKFMSLQTEIFSGEKIKAGIDTGSDDELKILAYCKEHGLDPKKEDDYKEAYVNAC